MSLLRPTSFSPRPWDVRWGRWVTCRGCLGRRYRRAGLVCLFGAAVTSVGPTTPAMSPSGRPGVVGVVVRWARLVLGVLRQDSMGALVPSGARGLHAPLGAGREPAWAPVVGTCEDPIAEDCPPEDCTCAGCTAQVCLPEDCTSKDNTSGDRFAEDCTADDCSSEEAGPSPGLWTVHGCSGPPATRRAGLRHGASFCHAAHSLREAVDSPGILGSYPSVLRWQVGAIPGPSSRIQARASNN